MCQNYPFGGHGHLLSAIGLTAPKTEGTLTVYGGSPGGGEAYGRKKVSVATKWDSLPSRLTTRSHDPSRVRWPKRAHADHFELRYEQKSHTLTGNSLCWTSYLVGCFDL
jgi:hypothetical protein